MNTGNARRDNTLRRYHKHYLNRFNRSAKREAAKLRRRIGKGKIRAELHGERGVKREYR